MERRTEEVRPNAHPPNDTGPCLSSAMKYRCLGLILQCLIQHRQMLRRSIAVFALFFHLIFVPMSVNEPCKKSNNNNFAFRRHCRQTRESGFLTGPTTKGTSVKITFPGSKSHVAKRHLRQKEPIKIHAKMDCVCGLSSPTFPLSGRVGLRTLLRGQIWTALSLLTPQEFVLCLLWQSAKKS